MAQTVASNGGCGSFEDYNFNRAKDTWVFTCQKPGLSYEIQAFGSQDARLAIQMAGRSERSDAVF